MQYAENAFFFFLTYVCVLVAQLCLTLCDPMDCNPPDSSIHGVLQARTLEWVPFTSPRDISDPGIKLGSPELQALFFFFSFFNLLSHQSVSSVTQSCPTLRPHELQHTRPPCPSPTPGVHSNSCPSSW